MVMLLARRPSTSMPTTFQIFSSPGFRLTLDGCGEMRGASRSAAIDGCESAVASNAADDIFATGACFVSAEPSSGFCGCGGGCGAGVLNGFVGAVPCTPPFPFGA